MIIKEYIKNFEKLGIGLFVHYGLYSVIGRGEWSKKTCNIPWDEYLKSMEDFNPSADWAEELAKSAKEAGCRYITFTTRHHDGFSLYDTCELCDFDAPHVCGRDLVAEFVAACRKHNIKPFFYHTLLDWHEQSYNQDFSKYLQYLRNSVELLCKNYGEIGGIWLDGMWDKRDADWEEDALYGMIRSYQPNAMIINNTGLNDRGALGHIELDSVTFERGRPQPINLENSPKYLASEMCEVMGCHWGFAERDLDFKSSRDIIESLVICRRYKSNFLLNVGPKPDGGISYIDRGILELVGKWTTLHKEALYDARATEIIVEGKPKDFVLKKDNIYYLFVHDLKMQGDVNVVLTEESDLIERFDLSAKIESVSWLDNSEPLPFTQEGSKVTVGALPFKYGENLVVRVAKIETI